MKNAILEKIKKILHKQKFMCLPLSVTQPAPVENLLVFLGLDTKKRERLLQIIANLQQVPSKFILPNTKALPYRIQFQVELPFNVQDKSLNQVASLLFFLNQFIDLPGFELDELKGQVIYRYVWIINLTAINVSLIMSIMGTIMLNLNLFSETIESLAKGEISFNELLSQVAHLSEHLPSFTE